jgi:hypothetical protein
MGGFASGFRAGYGLVNDTYEGIRREQQDAAQAQFSQDKLAAEQARLRQDSRYNSERLRLQGDGNRQQAEFNKDKLSQDSQYNKDRLALLAEGNRIADNKFRVESALDAATLQSTLQRNNAYGEYYQAEADKTDLETQTLKQRETIRSAISELQQTNSLSSGTLMNLRGTGINPAKFLAPDAGSQLTNSWQFALGQRTDYDSADFTAAMNFLFEADTGVMRGQVPEGKGSPIMGQRIVGMEPVEGQEGAFRLVVQNQLLNGDVYNSYMTRGRKAGAEPAVLTMDQIGQQLEANTSAFEAFNRPDLMRSLVANYTQVSPDVNNIAAALRKQDLENAQTVLSNEEYQRAAIGMLFGSMEAFAPPPPAGVGQAAAPGPETQPQAQPQRGPSQRPSIGEALAPIGDFLFGNDGNAPASRGNAGGLSANDLAALNPDRAPASQPAPSQDPGTAAVNTVLGSSAPAPQPTQPPSIGEIRRAIMMQYRGSDRFVNDLTDQEVLEYYRSGQVTL